MRLIDADALEKALEDTIVPHRLIAIIRRQPTIEPKRGRWIEDEYGIPHCSECRTINNTVYRHYCPNCGAKMDKKGAEQ